MWYVAITWQSMESGNEGQASRSKVGRRRAGPGGEGEGRGEGMHGEHGTRQRQGNLLKVTRMGWGAKALLADEVADERERGTSNLRHGDREQAREGTSEGG